MLGPLGEVGTATRWRECEPECDGCRRLHTATIDIAYELGSEHVTVETLAERAGLSTEDVVEHGGSAEECLVAAYRMASDDLIARFTSAFRGERESWHDRYARGTVAMLEHLAAHPALAHLCYVEAARAGRTIRDWRDVQMQRVIELMASEHDADGLPALRFELINGAVDRAIASLVVAARYSELRELGSRVAGITTVFEPV